MYACPRADCGGSVGVTWYGSCTLCARTPTGARPPTAEEEHSRGSGVVTETNYFRGIYAIGYIPTAEELSRAIW